MNEGAGGVGRQAGKPGRHSKLMQLGCLGAGRCCASTARQCASEDSGAVRRFVGSRLEPLALACMPHQCFVYDKYKYEYLSMLAKIELWAKIYKLC
jgi:hypothetical protein